LMLPAVGVAFRVRRVKMQRYEVCIAPGHDIGLLWIGK
jgi:hypothetical protein